AGVASGPFSMSANAQYFAYETATSPNEIYLTNVCTPPQPSGCTPSTILVSQDNTNSNVIVGGTTASEPSISADGRYVAFSSNAPGLLNPLNVTIPANSTQVYLRDTCTGVASGTTCTPSTT